MASILFELSDDQGDKLLRKLVNCHQCDDRLKRIEKKIDHVHKMLHAMAPDNAQLAALIEATARMEASGDAVKEALESPPTA